MRRYLSTSDGLATAIGVAILVATTNANIMATGGYFTSHAIVVAALSAGVFAGARVIGAGAAGKIAVAIVLALAAGEFYNLSATAERIVIERETNAAPLRAQREFHDAAARRASEVSAAPARSARLDRAVEAQSRAQAAYEKELREGGRCARICNGLKADAEKASLEVAAAAQEAQALHVKAIETAKAELTQNPLPASATPLADRIGWAPWVLDLIMAALLSVGANGLAGTLIAYGARRSIPDTVQTDFSASDFDAAKIKALVAGEIPGKPTPPNKPRKRGRKADQNVIDFTQKFREKNGRTPSGRDLLKAFPSLPSSTAYDYANRARTVG